MVYCSQSFQFKGCFQKKLLVWPGKSGKSAPEESQGKWLAVFSELQQNIGVQSLDHLFQRFWLLTGLSLLGAVNALEGTSGKRQKYRVEPVFISIWLRVFEV